MKFGGTSVADADCIRRCGAIVDARREQCPVVVVSALGGVTDLLVQAIEQALNDDLPALEPLLADIERRHRWAVAGCVEGSAQRHDLNLELDAAFEDLRDRLRSIRILGEGTPKALDAILGFGERVSSRIVAAGFRDAGIPARWVDARKVVRTDSRFGAAEPDTERTREAARAELLPILEGGAVPVLGGYIASDAEGEQTTLGRGGSDTTAALLGRVLEAKEIQIWTDVDGLMTADPRWVPNARRLDRVSFGEAAALAFYGAKVLHPASIAPAVERDIPVRVLNSSSPEDAGTLILGDRPDVSAGIASIATLRGLTGLQIRARRPTADPSWFGSVIEALSLHGGDLLLANLERGAALFVSRTEPDIESLSESLEQRGHAVEITRQSGLALICLIGSGLGRTEARAAVLSALEPCRPLAVSMGASSYSVQAVVDENGLADAVRGLHERYLDSKKAAS